MQPAVLHSCRGQHNHLLGEVNLTPLQLANLAASLARQQQQADDIRELVVTQTAPQRLKFLSTEDTLTAAILIGLGSALDWIGIEQSLGHTPVEERTQRTTQPVTGRRP